jgi:hypothetical protein
MKNINVRSDILRGSDCEDPEDVGCLSLRNAGIYRPKGEYCHVYLCLKTVLRRIFGPKRDEVTGGWRKLHNEELHNLYSSPSIIRVIKSRRMRWAGHAARMGESRNAYRILVGKPEGKRPPGRPRRRWVDNIKIDLREVGWDGRNWIDLAQDRDRWRAHVKVVMNLRVP